MGFAPIYLLNRFIFRITNFFHDWYVHGLRFIFHHCIELLSNIDETVALRLTLRHFSEPLYKDYTVVGRVLGVIFRSGRILIGVFVYPFVIVIFLALGIIWALIPVLIVLYALRDIVGGP